MWKAMFRLGGETLDSKSIGTAELKPANRDDGKREAEVLLTPGVFCELVTQYRDE